MRLIAMILSVGLLIAGCSTAETFEYVTDEPVQPVLAEPKQVYFNLAEEPAMPAMESDNGKLYLCGDYDVMLQTWDGGDLNDTVYRVSGFSAEDLTLIQTGSGEIDKYEFVWTSASDSGEQIGRATVLDDGTYHYVLSAVVSAGLIEEYQEIWNGIFESFRLV